ncbi:MAG: hypothetical protein ACQEQF_13070, partial [Bacillota bacterium]
MKKILYITFVLLVLLVAVHNNGEAAMSGDLVRLPTANMIDSTGEVGVILNDSGAKVTAIAKLMPWLEAGGKIHSNENINSELSPLVKVLLIDEYNYGLNLTTGYEDELYITSSKTLDYNLKGYLGFKNHDGLFVGVAKTFNEEEVQIKEKDNDENVISSIPPIRVALEYYNSNFNLGIRTNINKTLRAE